MWVLADVLRFMTCIQTHLKDEKEEQGEGWDGERATYLLDNT